ncbi:MAG: efflux RND transporter periplasmic adaptor subunit [candidate division Zixibacteria bacterium]|nr:efflux RND transporter periplasmic adaptor subunit [candidate division Zixibacteria bacterium]MDH3938864.1 efflux RND transporter periplasmic adaptor subunit [candidate division Zixibacteria bacterium]MDH4034948.1 efflux RND transporter periplasmic adaptor subunit [candidate division Zixibacteria bacterium]
MKKKTLLIILAVVALGVLVAVNLSMDTSDAQQVQVDKVTLKDVTELVSASGRIQPQTKVDITSEINGEIVGLFAREGEKVEAGELLVVLDTVQLRTDLDQARFAMAEVKARLAGAESRLTQADEEFQRQSKLFETQSSMEKQYTDAKYALNAAQATYDGTLAQSRQAQTRFDKQKDYLEKAKIVAPMSGIVTFLNCELGEIAAAQTAFTQGRTLMTIANLDMFEVEVEVDETEINKVELVQHVDIEVDAFPDTSFDGEVVEIGNTAITTGAGSQEQSTNFRVKVAFTDPRVKLRPGMSATVDITSASRERTLTIPYSAVVMRSFDLDSLERARNDTLEDSESLGVSEVHAAEPDEIDNADTSESDEEVEREELKGVFAVRDGVVRFIEITTGIADQKRIEVLTGLQEGDQVVSGPYRVLRTIKDGDAVEEQGKSDNDQGDE